jgi:hypothetical protein
MSNESQIYPTHPPVLRTGQFDELRAAIKAVFGTPDAPRDPYARRRAPAPPAKKGAQPFHRRTF